MYKSVKQSEKTAKIATGSVTGASHPVRSDFQIVKKQVVFFCEKSPPLAVARHSGQSGFWLFEKCYRIRKRFLTSEDIRMRTVIVKAKTVCTTYSKSEVTQGYLVALASPPPRTGSGLQGENLKNKCNIFLDKV